MSDKRKREIERKAKAGDPEAAQALAAMERRECSYRTIVDGWEGQWVYIDRGLWAECGLLVGTFIDVIGIPILELAHTKQKRNETGSGPEWTFDRPSSGVVRIPATEVRHAETAESRWGSAFKPWA